MRERRPGNLKTKAARADDPRVSSPVFILFQGRILNAMHLVSLVPPRPDGGKHMIEARMVGNVSFIEEYESEETAAGRYLDLAAVLLGDATINGGVRRDDTITLGR
jgi:hypothetical protein